MRRGTCWIVARIAAVGVIVLLTAQNVAAQSLDAAARSAVVDALIAELNRAYVFPDVAQKMATDLNARRGRGEYDAVADAPAFATRLTEDLQAISHDKHLRVRAGGPPSAPAAGTPASSPFGRTERLEGDIAYIEITTFALQPGQVREVVRDVMDEAADARAMILDVRRNGGGTPGLVALISSYLFGDEPVHLNSLYWRPTDTTQEFHTDPSVAGRRFGPDKPVYVLTSHRTFSAAEEFTYNLQARKRATIVGETTGGGAHPGGVVALPNGLSVFVPSGRAINPITKTDWEGTGITPDVQVPADDALQAALQRLRMKT
jgi:Peptidase family S41/N-terminal domain of Peptidase_S41 in eukaryotic IRBP